VPDEVDRLIDRSLKPNWEIGNSGCFYSRDSGCFYASVVRMLLRVYNV
jgi:hypothetical protein